MTFDIMDYGVYSEIPASEEMDMIYAVPREYSGLGFDGWGDGYGYNSVDGEGNGCGFGGKYGNGFGDSG